MKFSGSTPHQIIYSTYGDVVDVQDNEVSPSKILQATVVCSRFREIDRKERHRHRFWGCELSARGNRMASRIWGIVGKWGVVESMMRVLLTRTYKESPDNVDYGIKHDRYHPRTTI